MNDPPRVTAPQRPCIHLYVHGRGRGHATRSLVIGQRLVDEGYRVQLFAGPDAADLLASELPTAAVESLPPTLGPRALSTLARRLWAARRIEVEPPALVISDGDLPGVLIGRRAGVPTLAIGHGVTFAVCRPPPGVEAWAWRAEAAKAWVAAGAAHVRVAVNFVPLMVHDKKARLCRPTLELPEREAVDPRRVVCYFRDAPHRGALRALVERGLQPVLFAQADPGVPGVQTRPRDRASFLQALAGARGVLASSGSQLISECVALGVPFFGLYRPGDHEQTLNIAMLQHAGLGTGCSTEAFVPEMLEAWSTGDVAARRSSIATLPGVADVVVGLCEDLVGR